MKNLLILFLIIGSSCSYYKKKTERVVARALDDYLYESDLKGVLPPGTTARDSLTLTRNYIENWVNQKLIIHQAEINLTSEQMDFSRQLEDYQQSLIIFEYENALIKQKLDTLITGEQIENYYDANQNNFLLKDNIVQIQYVKLPLKSNYLKQIKKLLISDNQDDKIKLPDLCEKYATDYFLDDENWLFFGDVLKQIPIKTYNQEEFLKNRRELEYQDSLFVYLIKFKDFKIKESVSPLSLEKRHIYDILLNKRKIELISRMREDIYQGALKKNDFEIY